MNRRVLARLAAATALAMLVLPIGAQAHSLRTTRYKLIDLGTLGGPQSGFQEGVQILNQRGVAAATADTAMPDSRPTNGAFLGPDPFIEHAIVWQNGKRRDLGALPGFNTSQANWVNANRAVTGLSGNGKIDPINKWPEMRAVVWKDSRILNLGTLGGPESFGASINNRGQVAGFAALPAQSSPDPYSGWGTPSRAFIWQNGRMRDLGTLGGPDSWAVIVNERGQVAGWSFTNSTPNAATGAPTQDPFVWTRGKMKDLGTLGGTSGNPSAMNDRGEVVGNSNTKGDVYFHPFLWNGVKLKDLGTLGGNNAGANWINEEGDVVGVAELSGSATHHAFLWKPGGMKDLGTVSSDTCSSALGVNVRDQVVGASGVCHVSNNHAFLWERGRMFDLNTLVAPPPSGIRVTIAYSINDRGEVAASGTLPNGDVHAVLLIPKG